MKEETFKDRLLVEHQDLNGKLLKLSEFLNSPDKISKLDIDDQKLLFQQEKVMTEYVIILQTRLDRLK